MGRKYICPASICCLRGKHMPQRPDLMPKYQVLNFAVYSLAQWLLSCFSISSIITPKRNRYIIQRNQGVFVGIARRNLTLQGHAFALLSGIF